MAEFILEANERKVDKQSQLTEIRDNKRVPGIIYGFSQKPIVIDLDYMALLKVLKEAGTYRHKILRLVILCRHITGRVAELAREAICQGWILQGCLCAEAVLPPRIDTRKASPHLLR